jgi:hypothetical protein
MVRVMTRRAGAVGIVVGLLLGLVAIVGTPAPAGAAITAVSPASADVDPGGTTTATVRVSAGGFTCISVSAPKGDASVDQSCTPADSDGRNWNAQLTVHAPNEPGAQYTVTIHDDSFGGQDGRFTVRVRTPPPSSTTTAPTTTAPTTTVAPTTTTAKPATTTAPTTTAPTTSSTGATTTTTGSTTTVPPIVPADAFESVADLLQEPVATEGIFLPLIDDEFRSCLPLTTACSDDGSGLALVPARGSELLWQPLPGEDLPAPRSDLRGVQPIRAVGVGPENPGLQQYVLSMLDLTTSTPTLRSMVRALDGRGDFVSASGDAPRHVPQVQGPEADVQAAAGAADPTASTSTSTPTSTSTSTTTAEAPSTPFGKPILVKGATLTEAAPVLPMYAGSTAQVLYGVRADVAWGLNVEFLPLLGDSLPYLARRVDGPPGLFFARPAGVRVPEPPPEPGSVAVTPTASSDDGMPVLALLSLALILAGIGIGVAALVRRSRRPDGPRPAGGNVDDFFGDDM